MGVMFYVNKIILNEKVWESAKVYLSNIALFAAIIMIAKQIDIRINSYMDFFSAALFTFIVCTILFGMMNIMLNQKYFKILFKKMIAKVRE